MADVIPDEISEQSNESKRIALISTLGMSPSIVQFELETGYLNIPFDWLTLITTDSARENARDINWLSSHPASYEIIDIFKDSPQQAADLTRKIIEVIQNLRLQGYFVVADPTGGRKWMSAACSVAAAILNVPTIYVDARFKEGKPDPETMEQVDMASVLDALAHLELKEIEHFWASRNFPSVITACDRMAESAPRAFIRELGSVLSLVASITHDIDRFEIYREGKSPELLFERAETACKRLKKLDKEWKHPGFTGWLKKFQDYIALHASHIEESVYSISWLYGLVASSKNCIDLGRYDDAVARIKAAIEWSVKVALWQDYGVQIDDRSKDNGLNRYDNTTAGIGPAILNHIDRPHRNQPSDIYYIGFTKIIRLAMLLNEMEDEKPITYDFRRILKDYRSGKREFPLWQDKFNSLQDCIDKRNNSILAHGREAVSKDFADRFYSLCIDYLSTLTSKDVTAEVEVHILPPPPLT